MYSILAWVFAGLILIIIAIKVFRTKQQHRAASNVVFAKYTFESMKKVEQKEIKDKAKELVISSGTKMRGFANEVERFGWYALAMDDLKIASAIPENPHWEKIKNPYTVIIPGNYLLRAVSSSVQSEYGISVNISEAKNYQAKKSVGE